MAGAKGKAPVVDILELHGVFRLKVIRLVITSVLMLSL
jgi:hypothetical protein